MNYKPAGHTSVAPYLVVRDAAGTIAFLEQVFGAEKLLEVPDGDRIVHAEVRIDDTVVMLAEASDGYPPLPTHVHVYVRDVDAVYQRALAAGGESVMEPVRKDGSDRRGGVKDPGGTVTWWITTQTE